MDDTTKQQLMRAKRLIEAREFDIARDILLQTHHPKADEWLIRLNKLAPKDQPSFTGKLVVSVVLLFVLVVPGLIALSIFANEAKKYPKAPGAQGLIQLNKFVWWALIGVLFFGVIYTFLIVLALGVS